MTEYQDELIVLTEPDGTELIVTRTEVDPNVKLMVATMIVVDATNTRPGLELMDLRDRTSTAYACFVAEEAVAMLGRYLLKESTPAFIPIATRNLHRFILAYRSIRPAQR